MKKDAFSTIDGSELADVCGGFSLSLDYPGKSYWSGGGGGGAGDEQHGDPTEINRSVEASWAGFGVKVERHDKYQPKKS